MNFNSIDEIKENGFQGFKTVKELWTNKKEIPQKTGVYLVIDPNFKKTEFTNPGVGGFFKGKDPNVPIAELKFNQVSNSQIIYIGKAGGSNVKATLRTRLSQYLSFGQTKNAGHYGGRYIWQIKEPQNLIFCWKEIQDEEPVQVERSLINHFKDQFGKIPYANLK
jgi:hypothetical protein